VGSKPTRRKVVPISEYLNCHPTTEHVKKETEWPHEDLIDIQRWLRWADTALGAPKPLTKLKSPSRKRAA
jgi:hypothetical protein